MIERPRSELPTATRPGSISRAFSDHQPAFRTALNNEAQAMCRFQLLFSMRLSEINDCIFHAAFANVDRFATPESIEII